jgi:pantoate--beta-alanine ligase
MIVFKKSTQLTTYLEERKAEGKKIGFVPTMGALHKGHLSLFQQSVLFNDISVCSIFINPTQFNDVNDFRKYPVTIERDIYMLEETGVSILFLPGVEEVYPEGLTHLENFDLGNLENLLEGAFRPNHFQGVSQVMSRLLTIVRPHNLYMGQKDYQQCMVVQRLIQLMKVATVLRPMPTQREETGLAMSSRNARLSEEQKKKAVTISGVLTYLKQNLKPGDLTYLIATGKEMLAQQEFKTDYVAITDTQTLEPVNNWNGKQPLVALIAAFINDVRLIDNMTLTA